MHEYQHVIGYQTQAGQAGGARDAAEVTAYAWEIRNAEMTKLSAKPLKVADQWEHLADAFAKLTKNEAVQLAPLARVALQMAQKLVKGSGARLSPLPPI